MRVTDKTLISEFWLASVEVSGEAVDAAQMERGVALMLQVLDPRSSLTWAAAMTRNEQLAGCV
jgi:hypothetical protein